MRTPREQVADVAQAIADAIADGLDAVVMRLTDSLAAAIAAEQENRANITALVNRIESVARAVAELERRLDDEGDE